MRFDRRTDHAAASRMLGHALTLGAAEAWGMAAFVFRLRLSPAERAALAWTALRSLDPDHAEAVAETIGCYPGGAGTPMNPTGDPVDEAALWTNLASEDEIDAYAVAALRAMSAERRREFLDYARRGVDRS